MYGLCNNRPCSRWDDNTKIVVVVYPGLNRLRTGPSSEFI